MSVPILITMQGQLPTPPYSVVVWTVYNTPDNTGAFSGYGAGVLMNIGVTAVSAVGSPVNPLTLVVGGDLTGSLPSPSVSGIQGRAVSTNTPTIGQALVWQTIAWVPTTLPSPSAVLWVAFKVESGAATVWATNTGVTPTVNYDGVGLYTVTVPGASIGDSVAWTNVAPGGGSGDGFTTQAIPLAPGQPTKAIVTCWDSLDAQAADPANPDTILTLFWIG